MIRRLFPRFLSTFSGPAIAGGSHSLFWDWVSLQSSLYSETLVQENGRQQSRRSRGSICRIDGIVPTYVCRMGSWKNSGELCAQESESSRRGGGCSLRILSPSPTPPLFSLSVWISRSSPFTLCGLYKFLSLLCFIHVVLWISRSSPFTLCGLYTWFGVRFQVVLCLLLCALAVPVLVWNLFSRACEEVSEYFPLSS